jgi:hypothetical protein
VLWPSPRSPKGLSSPSSSRTSVATRARKGPGVFSPSLSSVTA